ncbi:MAG TPA: MBL fold metallo-hydrolase [Candidatus Paceibacterota bacterium]|jgi:L-ascorbate metabolism protein UlaG (beta-lactamase superfamily)|nr:MBL fold metallo-hydrolase [Candidatus Paceibacterota bacterium]
MKIKKLGHCCLVIETNGKRIMTDPGSYTVEEQTKESNIDIILITHEHADHFHLESLKKVLVTSPNIIIITNNGVGKLLDEVGIKYQVLENKVPKEIVGVELEAHDCKHEEIFEEIGQVQNTGYFIGKRLFYPGDAFYNPNKPVEILAVGVAGPWSRIRDFMRYILEIKPKFCFPVHDGGLKSSELIHRISSSTLPAFNIIYKSFAENKEEEF